MNVQKKSNTVLVVVDVQNAVMQNAYNKDEVLKNIISLVQKARAEKTPVIWVQHEDEEMQHGSEGWKLVSALGDLVSEVHIYKKHNDAFEETPLKDELNKLEVGRLVVCGAQSEICIRATIHGGFALGYDVALVADAHTTDDLTEYGQPAPDKIIALTNRYWKWNTGVGRKASVEKAAEVKF